MTNEPVLPRNLRRFLYLFYRIQFGFSTSKLAFPSQAQLPNPYYNLSSQWLRNWLYLYIRPTILWHLFKSQNFIKPVTSPIMTKLTLRQRLLTWLQCVIAQWLYSSEDMALKKSQPPKFFAEEIPLMQSKENRQHSSSQERFSSNCNSVNYY